MYVAKTRALISCVAFYHDAAHIIANEVVS